MIPIIDLCMRLKADGSKVTPTPYAPIALIIGPTRELILQIYENATKFAASKEFNYILYNLIC